MTVSLGIPPALLRLTGTALALLGALAGPVAAQTITVAIGTEPATLDPQALDDGAERAVNDNIYETLYVRDAAAALSPGLAVDLPRKIDDLTWEVDIKSGITFTNGEPLDAEAVAYSINRIVDPELESNQLSYVGTLASAEAVDEDTVRITTTGPDPVLTSRLYWLKIVPPVYSQDPAFAEAPVGTGPFRFVRWDRGQEIVLERNPDYWGPAPAIEGVTVRFIPDASTRLAGLLAGELDLISNVAPEFTDQLPKVAATPSTEVPTITFNSRPGSPFEDVRVRQATLYAIDRQALADGLFEGFATVTNGVLAAPAVWGYDASLKGYPYDPEKARALLEEAGAVGRPVELVAPGGRFLKDREIAEAIASYLTEAGFEVTLTIPEWSVFLERIFNREVRPDVYYASASNELFDIDRALAGGYDRDSITGSHDDDVIAALIPAARVELDPVKRQELVSEILRRAEEQAILASLLNTQDIYGLSERLTWQPRVDGKLILSGATVAN